MTSSAVSRQCKLRVPVPQGGDAAGLSAYGFTIVPVAHADALRRFVLDPVRSTLRALFDRPPPFDTYHTSADALPTLEPAALALAVRALAAVVRGLR